MLLVGMSELLSRDGRFGQFANQLTETTKWLVTS